MREQHLSCPRCNVSLVVLDIIQLTGFTAALVWLCNIWRILALGLVPYFYYNGGCAVLRLSELTGNRPQPRVKHQYHTRHD